MADVVIGVAAAVAAVGVAAWQTYQTHRKAKMESCDDPVEIHKNLIEMSGMLCAIRYDYEDVLKKNEAKMKATCVYTNWSDMVIKWKLEADEILFDYNLQTQTHKWKIRRENVKHIMKKKTVDACVLCERAAQLGVILVEKEPDRFIMMNVLDIKNLPTFQDHLQAILNCVTNENNKVRGIKVWGFPCSGKSIIMKNLNNHKKVHEYFDLVIWLNVSTEQHENNLGIDKLRQKVAQRLKLNLEGVGDHEVADMIKEKLKNKKTLLLLHDVKKNLTLSEIGIDLDNENGIKIVLTTTVRSVCQSVVNKVIVVKNLPDKEACDMFNNILTPSQRKDPYIQCVVVQVVQQCYGIPILLQKVANSFKMRETVDSWKEGYEKLIVFGNVGDNQMVPVYKSLNACFDNLGEKQRKCVFYSTLYPQDCDVYKDCLYECWAAEGLYGAVSSIDSGSVRAHGIAILEDLTDATLLEECANREYVRMQKFIREAALYKLASNDTQEHLVETGKSLQRPPNDEQWKNKVRISLADNDLETLPARPECSNLSTLFLQKNPLLTTIPDAFFKSMGKLKVLNVNDTGINPLPNSMSNLTNVKVVYLNGCSDLDVFPSQIIMLQNVEVLDICRSGINAIPPEITSFKILRRLSVSFPNFDNEENYKVVSENCKLISEVSKLEVLIIDVRSHKILCSELKLFVIDKVASTLSSLTTFKFCFDGGFEDYVVKTVGFTPIFDVPTADAFKGFLQRGNLNKSFRVFIGYSSSSAPLIPNLKNYKKYLRYCNGMGSDATICKLLTKVDALEMFDINELEYLSDFGIQNLENIRGCLIGACNQIRAIANNSDSPILVNLEDLYVKMMPALVSILLGPISSPLGSLCKLKTLKIESCPLIEEVLADSGTAAPNDKLLPHLETLIIDNCPLMTTICSYNSLVWPALKELQIISCEKLAELPFGENGARKMESIKAEKGWWDRLTWHDQEVKDRLEILLPTLRTQSLQQPARI